MEKLSIIQSLLQDLKNKLGFNLIDSVMLKIIFLRFFYFFMKGTLEHFDLCKNNNQLLHETN